MRGSPALSPLIDAWPEVALPNAWIAAGSIAQSVWNHVLGLPPLHGISVVNLVYFDEDLSEVAEASAAARIQRLFAELPVRIDVKNEARVHLWYAAKFGYRIEPYASMEAAIATFPTTATAIAVHPVGTHLAFYAPFGLSDLFNLVVRPNKAQITRAIYEAKVKRWRALWPTLTVIDW